MTQMTGTRLSLVDLVMNMTACEIIAELQGSWVYSVIIAGKALLCIIGAILSAIQWRKRGVAWLIHANSKTLFSFYYGLIVAIGLSYGGMYWFEFGRLRFPCFIFDFRILLVIRIFGMASIVASHFVMVSISLERLYSSVFPLHFEKHTSRIVGIFVSTTIILVTFFLLFFSLSGNFQLFGKAKLVATIDLRTPENSDAYNVTFYVMTFIFIPTSLFFCVDVYMNFYGTASKTKNVPLAVAYQYSENRMVISTLIPLEIANSAMAVSATVAQAIYNKINPDVSYVARALFVEISASSPLYPLLFAFILEWRLRNRKQRNIGDLQREQEDHNHFDAMRSQWS